MDATNKWDSLFSIAKTMKTCIYPYLILWFWQKEDTQIIDGLIREQLQKISTYLNEACNYCGGTQPLDTN